jgi:hypothetical protein
LPAFDWQLRGKVISRHVREHQLIQTFERMGGSALAVSSSRSGEQ